MCSFTGEESFGDALDGEWGDLPYVEQPGSSTAARIPDEDPRPTFRAYYELHGAWGAVLHEMDKRMLACLPVTRGLRGLWCIPHRCLLVPCDIGI